MVTRDDSFGDDQVASEEVGGAVRAEGTRTFRGDRSNVFRDPTSL